MGYGDGLLAEALGRAERNPDSARLRITGIDEARFSSAAELDEFRAEARRAERLGAVSLEHRRPPHAHIMHRLRVLDIGRLASLLGRRTTASAASATVGSLRPLATQPWLSAFLDRLEERWATGSGFWGVDPMDTARAAKLMRLLGALADNRGSVRDPRAFSAAVTGDSKDLERLRKPVAALLALEFGLPSNDPAAVLPLFGIESYPDPILVRGSIAATGRHGMLDVSGARPYAGIAPECAESLAWTRTPDYLLTVENKASFHRHVREVQDSGAAIYLGGFPSSAVSAFLHKLLLAAPSGTPFFHWGDIDEGGLKIFRRLECTMPVQPWPHLMDTALLDTRGLPCGTRPDLAAIAGSASRVAPLAAHMLALAEPRWLEQEAVCPVPCLSADVSQPKLSACKKHVAAG
jgi:hypothetical protein